jgi:hypothetical protein
VLMLIRNRMSEWKVERIWSTEGSRGEASSESVVLRELTWVFWE